MFFFGISPVFSTNPEVFMTILMGLDLLQNAASIFGSQCKHKDLYATSNTQFVVFFFPKDPVGPRTLKVAGKTGRIQIQITAETQRR